MRFPVLIYHGISRTAETAGKYSILKEKFEKHVTLMNERNVCFLSAPDIFADRGRFARERPHVMLTFDDGRLDNYTLAFPILLSHNISGTFFVVTGRIGKDGYMTWEHLKEMNEAGMSIQSHTVTHRHLSLLNFDEVKQELIRSKKTIEDNLSMPVHCLSLPHGDSTTSILELAFQVGYKRIFTSVISFAKPDQKIIPRINIWGSISERKFAQIVKCDNVTRLQLRALQLLKLIVKKGLRVIKKSC